MGISLLKEEKILETAYPHILSMINIYFFWIYTIFIGILTLYYNSYITNFLNNIPFEIGIKAHEVLYFIIWSLVIVIPTLFLAFIRINWNWLFIGILISSGGICVYIFRENVINTCYFLYNYIPFKEKIEKINNIFPIWLTNGDEIKIYSNYWLIIIGILGLIISNSYRKAHRYYITNHRIIARFGFFMIKERDLLYSKIDDLIIHQNLLGRIFNFGTLIPISASGLGTGSNQVFLAASGGKDIPLGPSIKVTIGGGRTITIPRAPSFYSLYGISNPEKLKNIIISEMEKREYGYSKRMKK